MSVLKSGAVAAFVVAVLATGAAGAQPVADPVAAGDALFQSQCSLCHAVTPGEMGQGPELNGVVGRKIAGVADFPYSDGLKSRGREPWTAESLDAYLTDPQAFATGGAMPIKVENPKDRAALIAYLATTK